MSLEASSLTPAFDKFAPMGPRLVHPSKFVALASKIQTRVNGKTLQDSPLDFIFPIAELISFLSQGLLKCFAFDVVCADF